MPLSFRAMQEVDLDAISEIESASFSDPWIREFFAMELNHDAFVAVKDDQVIGYICAWQVLDECTITNIAVHPLQRQKGIAGFMFTKLTELMEERSVRYYYLEVRTSNLAALSLYRKLGFIQVGCRKAYYHNPVEDAIVMSFDMSQPLAGSRA